MLFVGILSILVLRTIYKLYLCLKSNVLEQFTEFCY